MEEERYGSLHTSAYVSIRQHPSAYVRIHGLMEEERYSSLRSA
jgi:hypothetical protein